MRADPTTALYTAYFTRRFTTGLTPMNWHTTQAVEQHINRLIADNPHVPTDAYLQALTTALATTLTAAHGTSAEEPIRAALTAVPLPTDHPTTGA